MQQMIFIADLIACSTFSGTIMPIIRSSRVLYKSGLRAVAEQPADHTHNHQHHTIPTT